MTTATGFLGVDPDALHRLAGWLERTGEDLLTRRREIERLLVNSGMSPAVARRIVEVEDWLADATTDVRRRAATASAPSERRPPVSTVGARVVATVVSKPRFRTDTLSGKGLSGYAGVGLAYRHLGVQTRSVTRTWEWPDGHETVTTMEQRRGVFSVEPGLGWENIALIRFRPRIWYDPWR